MRGRYLPLGIIAALTVAVETAALTLTAACSAFADAKRGVINDMSAMLIEDSVDLYRQVSEAGTVKRIGGYINAGGTAILMVTHDTDLTVYSDRIIKMKAGMISDETE